METNIGLSEQERLMLLTSQLNFLSCNLNAFWTNHLWLRNNDAAKDINDIFHGVNDELEKLTDKLILQMNEICAIDELQASILKPMHKALSIKNP